MQINRPNILYALRHPTRAIRYALFRDVISYKTIGRHIPASPVILEAGAANGANTVEMATFWPTSTIHAFEPVPGARELLRARTIHFPNRVLVYNEALGNQSGSLPMWISGTGGGDSQSSSLLEPSNVEAEYNFIRFNNKIKVPVTTLDAWAYERSISKVDFLWLDMQGFELNALRGGVDILKTVQAIHMEVSNVRLYEGAPLAAEVYAFMKEHGFAPRVEAMFRVAGNVLFAR